MHEQRWAWDMRAYYRLPANNTEGCKRIDYLALFVEAYFLMRSKGEGWVDPMDVRSEALRLVERDKWHLACLEPGQARTSFLAAFHELSADWGSPEWWEQLDKELVDGGP